MVSSHKSPKSDKLELSDEFLSELHADWKQNGSTVLETLRIEQPDFYMRAALALFSHEMGINAEPIDEMDHVALHRGMSAARYIMAVHDQNYFNLDDNGEIKWN